MHEWWLKVHLQLLREELLGGKSLFWNGEMMDYLRWTHI
jgi:hypothetical protein